MAGQLVTTGAHPYCERMHGIGADYLVSAKVVVSRNGGEIIECSATENADLFWAIKGAGSAFGIIAEMMFRVIEAPNQGKYVAGQRVYLPTGFLGMPNRSAVMKHILKKMDPSQPHEYSCAATLLGGSVMNPSIVMEMWFGENHDKGREHFAAHKDDVGFAVADTYGVHDYWTGIQRWANGPKGEGEGSCVLMIFTGINYSFLCMLRCLSRSILLSRRNGE